MSEFKSFESEKIKIFECDTIGEIVVGILDYESKQINEKYNRTLYKSFGNLLVVDSSFDQFNDFNQVTEIVEKRYQPIIHKKYFSKNNGIWTGYTEIDIEHLAELIK